ncbi:hypothetical protein M2480_002179 [Parabacteroides sp. PFB2-12]|nr:hypothetical protein [Parabacteroides sp. PFB2-12]
MEKRLWLLSYYPLYNSDSAKVRGIFLFSK